MLLENMIYQIRPSEMRVFFMQTETTYTDITSNTDKVINNYTDITDITSKGYSSKKYKYECDELYEQLSDLVGDTRFRAFYIKAFYKLGRREVLKLASICRQEHQKPANAFGWKIRQAMSSGSR